MTTYLRIAGLVIVASCLVCAGCATAQSSPAVVTAPALTTIPTGQWAGTGTYAEYEGHEDGTPAATPAKSGSYPTKLTISRRELYGRQVLVFEIASQRGRLEFAPGEESNVAFAIRPAQTLGDGTVLYSLLEFAYNEPLAKQADEQELKRREQAASASCIRSGGKLVLQVAYMLPEDHQCFWDTFTFDGQSVRKAGRIVEFKGERGAGKLTSIDWAEELRPAQ